MKFLRSFIALFAALQIVNSTHAFFAGPYYGGYGPYYGGWWGYPSRGTAAAGIAVGGATNIIGAALTADAIRKSQPGYWEYKAEKEQREAEESRARREERAARRGYGPYYRD